jgi:hypothetical protein
MLSEVETCESYLNREDSFFYSLVFDATNQTLLADKGKIDVGEKHQAEIPEKLPQSVIDHERGLDGTSNEEMERENGDLQIDEPDAENKPDEEKKQSRERHHSQNINGVYETR